jgi:hypothetical protein
VPGRSLDKLYNIGGINASNTLIAGISSPNPATFNFACSASLGGTPYALRGVVFADAEQTGGGVEYVEATIPSSATWRIVDRVRPGPCTFSVETTRTDNGTFNTLRVMVPTVCSFGPTAVAYADGATSGTATVGAAGGRQAVALGIDVAFDRGDAPASYGEAAHMVQHPLTSGAPGIGTTSNVSEPAFALADPTQPVPRLGATVDPGGGPSANADGDDATGSAGLYGVDDDETADPPPVSVGALATLAQPGIACTGPGTVAGWIDFNANGVFDATERSADAACAGSTVDLTWTVPAGAVSQARTFERLRIAANAAEIATPRGAASSGEVEDHPLALTLIAPPPPPPPPLPPPPPPPPPPPVDPEKGQSVAVAESDGRVLVRVPGSSKYVDINKLEEIPVGSRIDARQGEVTIKAEVDAKTGRTQSAVFYDGVFVVTQDPGSKAIVEVTLTGGDFSGCSSKSTSRVAFGAAGGPIPFEFAAAKSKRVVRQLWGKGKGNFRTRGKRSSATVRGTWWHVADRCDGTFTRVKQGTVDVRDFAEKKTIVLKAGKRSEYLAMAP